MQILLLGSKCFLITKALGAEFAFLLQQTNFATKAIVLQINLIIL